MAVGIHFYISISFNSFYSDLIKLVDRCPQIRELDLSDCTTLSSKTIEIVSKLKNLEYLSLSRCYNISVSAYL